LLFGAGGSCHRNSESPVPQDAGIAGLVGDCCEQWWSGAGVELGRSVDRAFDRAGAPARGGGCLLVWAPELPTK